ncbi:histidinol-phosphate transaminase [Marinilabiliaceae bacterium ANBcel2]|nr:histidinol-phosphate transaminase [Marinilabiliaceae bacterium ANBcel2]
MRSIDELIRPCIKNLKPYSSARDEYTGSEGIFLDANENPFNNPLNRYPDPRQRILKNRISSLKGVNEESIFLGNGSDEAIDLIFRAFCEPAKENVISIDPTYGMYQVAAGTNNIEVKNVSLKPDFSLDTKAVLKAANSQTKIVWLCSPNNPTGNCLQFEKIKELLTKFNGIVVVDEAYIDFAPGKSLISKLNEFPNLIILQTFSKAWGVAGIRLGMAFANKKIIDTLNKIKYPYNINSLTQQTAIEMIKTNSKNVTKWIDILLQEREKLSNELIKLPFITKIYPSEANFLLVNCIKPKDIYSYLTQEKIIVRDRSNVTLCEGCLRITVGTPDENKRLLIALTNYNL